MIIDHLSLSGFRFFRRLEMSFPSRTNIIVGRNAQGKTSVLEAIHFLSLMTSPIASHDRQMVNFQTQEDAIPVGRITADIYKKEKPHHLEARLILNKHANGNISLRKEVLVDGVQRKLLETVGFFNSVVFLPQNTRIIEDGPSERRRYLDRTISQAYPKYVRALSVFNQAITRRNALLKQLSEQGGSPDQLQYWDDLVAENGALLISLRAKAIDELNTYIQVLHNHLSAGLELIELHYQPSLDVENSDDRRQEALFSAPQQFSRMDNDAILSLYQQQLRTLHQEEIRRGVTTVGPHRDDLQFMANGIDLGVYGSRGQIRTAVMALKLAEVHWLKDKTGETPVLLLDETLAELDEQRREQLLAELAANSQSIMTTTDLHLFHPEFVSNASVWQLKDGAILPD